MDDKRKFRLIQALTRIFFGMFSVLYLTIMSVAFLVNFSTAEANDIDVNMTIPSPPTPAYTFECHPKETMVEKDISCRVHLINSEKVPTVNEPVKILSSRNKTEQIDTITPLTENSDINGYADFTLTSKTAGGGTLLAILIKENSYIGDPVAFKFLAPPVISPATETLLTVSYWDIYSDKTKLVIGKDKAKISVKLLDQNSKPMPTVNVTLLYDPQYGESDEEKGLTNNEGIATFTYTPKKKGQAEIGAKAESTPLDKKITLEITEGTLLDQIQASPVAQNIASVLNPVITTATAVGLVTLIATILSSAPATFHALIYSISLIIEALGFRRKKKNWGRVYDSTTGKGVDLALVRLYDQKTMKLVGTIITNVLGHFNFQPKPGTYVISVIKEGFVYPTQIFAKYGIAGINKKAKKAYYHYLGQPVNITEKDYFLNIDIPIDPIGKEPFFSLKAKIWIEDLSHLIAGSLSYIFIPTLILGTLSSAFVAIVLSGKINLMVATIYFLFTVVFVLIKMIRSQQFGKVFDSEGNPLSGVMIEIFDKKYNTLKASQITDRLGRFLIPAEAGEYLLKAESSGYEFDPEKIEAIINKGRARDKFYGQTINMKRAGYIKLTVFGKKIEEPPLSSAT